MLTLSIKSASELYIYFPECILSILNPTIFCLLQCFLIQQIIEKFEKMHNFASMQ